jgi:hypothetical protein
MTDMRCDEERERGGKDGEERRKTYSENCSESWLVPGLLIDGEEERADDVSDTGPDLIARGAQGRLGSDLA